MIQIKKTILTLVALLAVTTGAWAQGVLNIVVDGTSATIKYDGNASNNPYFGDGDWEHGGETWDDERTTRSTITTVTIDGSCKNFSGTNLHGLFAFFSGLTTINGLENLNTANVQDMGYMFIGCSSLTSLDLSSWNTASVEFLASIFNECSELTTLDLSSWNTAKVWNTNSMFNKCSKLENIYVGDGWSTAAVQVDRDNDMFTGCTKLLSMNTANPATNKTNAHTGDGGYLKVKPAPASGPEVAWNAATKTGTFTMPGGNVTVSVEYYDLATLADKGLTAAEAAAAKTEAPLAVLAENAITGGTVMYYVAPDANFSQADAIALAETAWSADIPTAETIDAEGTYYVWYYIKGDDEHSDTDPQPLAVTVLPEPTYAVEFAEGTEESDKWTVKAGTDGSFQSLPLKGVKAGTKVKLKYDGDRSMLKAVTAVKAEKKAAAAEEPVADIVWDATNVSDIIISGSGESSYEKGGVTLSDNGEQKYAMWYDYGDPTMNGIGFSTNASGGYTFTAPDGKKFTKIEMTVNGTGGWQSANLGTGWAFNADMDKQIFTVTWKGSATSTVKLLTDADAFGGDTVTSIAFYLSE